MPKRNLIMLVLLASVAPLSAHQGAVSAKHHAKSCPHSHFAAAWSEDRNQGLEGGGSLFDIGVRAAFAP
jgi:hypothetical protein